MMTSALSAEGSILSIIFIKHQCCCYMSLTADYCHTSNKYYSKFRVSTAWRTCPSCPPLWALRQIHMAQSEITTEECITTPGITGFKASPQHHVTDEQLGISWKRLLSFHNTQKTKEFLVIHPNPLCFQNAERLIS